MFLRGVCIICVNKIVNVCYVNILVFNKWLYVLNIYYIKSGFRIYMFIVV